ncbi:MAG: monofunctional biosynthetic peptidoglycan transglycosylase [Sphingobacterium thalpophilum]
MSSFKLIVRLIQKVIVCFLAISLVWVLIYRFVNPPITFLMIQRAVERKIDGKDFKIHKSWLPVEDISANLKKAAIAGEDINFLDHKGFDFKAMERAFVKNKKGKSIRGGSTISQQTAKNVFLWPGRSYIRKAFEAYFTILIELLWGKERILEVYLNVIEMGDGIYGAEAAVQNYWGKSANSMSKSQASLLIAVLPNPRRWSPARPSRFVYYKQSLILRNMRSLKKVPF